VTAAARTRTRIAGRIATREATLYDALTPERRRRELRDEITTLRARIDSHIDIEAFIADDEETES
jgi:hypothetical protein